MSAVPIIGFSAFSGTGKTSLIEKLIPCLRARGLRVAVLKHDGHRFEIDKEGKDSFRYTEAGAEMSLICSGEKAAVVESRGSSLEEMLRFVHDVDIVLVEGWKKGDFPRIGLARAAVGKGFAEEPENYAAVVTDMEGNWPCPAFGFDEIEEITEFIMKNMEDFTHFNGEGRAKMVDVGDKAPSRRSAVAAARVLVSRETFELIRSGGMKKGDVLTVAQIAGVMGAKRTPELIPMCHPIMIEGVDMHLSLDSERCSVEIEAAVSCSGRTGVEMEALTAAATAALTVYDMCKAVQKDIVIADLRLMEKSGGVQGDYKRED